MNIAYAEYLNLLKLTLSAACYDESAWSLLRSDRRTVLGWFGRLLVSALDTVGLGMIRKKKFSWEDRSNGQDTPLFSYTMVGLKRLDNVQNCVEQVIRDNVKGDLLEAGCWRGGVGILMKAILNLNDIRDRQVILADSFEGMPGPKFKGDGADLSNQSYLRASLDEVKRNFDRFGLFDENVIFIKGFFEHTLRDATVNKIAVLRADGDLYHSTMDILENLYPKVEPGGFVIIDDYFSWEPCRKAVTDYLNKRDIRPNLNAIDKDSVYWRVSE